MKLFIPRVDSIICVGRNFYFVIACVSEFLETEDIKRYAAKNVSGGENSSIYFYPSQQVIQSDLLT